MTDTLQSDQPSASEQAADQAKQVGDTAKDQASQLAAEAADHAKGVMAEARSSARSQLEDRGQNAAELAKSLADELRSMADNSDGDRLSGFARQGADQLEQSANRFEEGGLDAVTSEVSAFARRRPWAFLAGTFVAGFAAGRVLRNADTDELKQAVQEQPSQDSNPTSQVGPGVGQPTTVTSPPPSAPTRPAGPVGMR